MKAAIVALLSLGLIALLSGFKAPSEVNLAFPKTAPAAISADTMQEVYAALRTDRKLGIVLKLKSGNDCDCPVVFRDRGQWYMTCIVYTGRGYETWLAQSSDLKEWTPLGRMLKPRSGEWDCEQAGGGAVLVDTSWDGDWSLQYWGGKRWMTYVGGESRGYEPSPLSIGVVSTTSPITERCWRRTSDDPALATTDPDVRSFERVSLFRSFILWDKASSFGFPLVMLYNATDRRAKERIGLAVSSDMVNWKRFGKDFVFDETGQIGDPQIIRMGDLWVMAYFRDPPDSPNAYDTFAVSRDLVHWQSWPGPPLVAPSQPFDRMHAHKPWIVHWKGVTYHFYCAVGSQGRAIALATSE